MYRLTVATSLLVLFLSPAAPLGAADLPDHLKCYKIKDPVKLKGVLDVDTPQFGPESGCTVSKAKLFCVPATKTVVSVEDKATGLPLSPLPMTGVPTAEDRVCYKLKCDAQPADQEVTDQFGTRTLSKLKASMVCTPAVKGTAYCGDGVKNGAEACDGGDLGGATCASAGFSAGTLACGQGCALDTSACGGSSCGDGVTDFGEGEECDDGNNVTETVCPYVFGGDGSCTVCTSDCFELEEDGPHCGDGVTTEPYEVCDDGNTLACGRCSADCRVEQDPATATGLILALPAASFFDGETFTVADGLGTSVVFEFDTASDGGAGGNTAINVSGADPASLVAQRIEQAIDASALQIDVVRQANLVFAFPPIRYEPG